MQFHHHHYHRVLCTVKSVKAFMTVMLFCVHFSICSRLVHWMSHC